MWKKALEDAIDDENYYYNNKWIKDKVITPMKKKLDERRNKLLSELLNLKLDQHHTSHLSYVAKI
jgi:hypothetical protein